MTSDPSADLAPLQRRRTLSGVIVAMAAMAMMYGFTGPLFSIVLEERGVSGSLIGFNGASQMAGVFLALPLLPYFIRRFGPARVMISGALVLAAALALMMTFIDVWLWFPLRFAIGAAQSAMWTTGETWINHATDDRGRSRTVSIFMSVVAVGYATGPFVLAEVGAQSQLPFVLALCISPMIMLPLLLGWKDRISSNAGPSARLPAYIRLAPVPMISNLVFGMAGATLIALLAVYGLRMGMEEGAATRMIGWMGWGGVVAPLAIGFLANRLNRTLFLAGVIAASGLAMLALPLAVTWSGTVIAIYLMIFGGIRTGQWGLAMMLVGDRFRGADLPSATTVFGFMFGIGSIMGPALSGLAMDAWDPHGLVAAFVIFHLLTVPIPLIDWWRSRRANLQTNR
ncbi:MAG: hypothetical protein CMM46_16345 [Rhodospirillaceae bacterium]|nr:hypothetical protein [Rhodospirillaceae bacterium]|tara:strand:- start:83 stop:1276 length:1194 start_codon:yes stop_codon:yes gene_type:complete